MVEKIRKFFRLFNSKFEIPENKTNKNLKVQEFKNSKLMNLKIFKI